ncbi:MAG: acyl-CoA/acyl-ACP dehydrogenase [Actinobacteria bacterium]|nr:acyl-CoA/acyl-ACP dehydrogenase [Actinomycetota bacterium]
MDLDLTPEQEMLRETVRGVCEQHAPLTVVRELEDDPVGYPEKLWAQLAGLDLCGLLLPDEHGGAGMSMLDAVIVYEELGRSVAPVPHFVSTVISGGVLARAGTAEQQREWLPRVAAGEVIVSPAWLEPEHGFGPAGVQLRAEADGDGYRLNGTKRHVAFAAAADRLLVLARTGDADTDIGLFLVDPKVDGVELTQQHTIASDTQYRVEFRDAPVAGADRFGEPPGWDAWDATMLDGVILLAAQAIGGATQALDITVEYAKQRHQFDKPLGAFQAIAHYLADAATTVDGGRTLVYEAGWARTVGRPIDRLAPMAKLFACQTYRDVTAMAQQVFGGVGFTVDFDIQLYFRRAKQLQLSWWDPRYLEERVAATVLDRA